MFAVVCEGKYLIDEGHYSIQQMRCPIRRSLTNAVSSQWIDQVEARNAFLFK